jgi:hypothetical protein
MEDKESKKSGDFSKFFEERQRAVSLNDGSSPIGKQKGFGFSFPSLKKLGTRGKIIFAVLIVLIIILLGFFLFQTTPIPLVGPQDPSLLRSEDIP